MNIHSTKIGQKDKIRSRRHMMWQWTRPRNKNKDLSHFFLPQAPFIIASYAFVIVLRFLTIFGTINVSNNYEATKCGDVTFIPSLILGTLMFILSLLGFWTKMWHVINECLLGFMGVTILGILFFRISVAYSKLELGSYSPWLQKLLVNENKWGDINYYLIQRQIG